MTRTPQILYQRLTRPAVIGYTALLIVLLTLVLCLANFGLTKYAVIGVLAGVMFWEWPIWVRYLLGLAILLIFIAACGAFSENQVVYPHFIWPAIYKAQIVLNSSGKIWTAKEQVIVPGITLRQITEGNGRYSEQLRPPKPDQYQKDIELLTRMVKSDGLVFTGVENGTDPMFSFPPITLTHAIPVLPLVTAQTVDLPYETLRGNVNIVPGVGSSVIITGPSAVIDATTPASQAEPTTTGEERVIEAGSLTTNDTGSISISISTLSIVARAEPMRFIAGLSLSGGIAWAVAGIWTLLVALMQTSAKATAKAGWQRIHHSKATASDVAKTDKDHTQHKPPRPKAAPPRRQQTRKVSRSKGARPKRAPH